MNEELRKRAQKEAKEDLNKSLLQLLTDIHEEIINPRATEENVIHAQKRYWSLVANIAYTNDKLSKRVLWLTILTTVLAAIQVIPIIKGWLE